VSEGNPDKVCDRISDSVVDAYLAAEPEARVACETLATTNRVVIAGEVRGPESITTDKVIQLARDAIKDIGYEQDGFHWKNAEVDVYLHAQSAHIAQGVDASGNKDEGAGDQGIMFGYACNETPELMPAPIYYAHKILENLTHARKAKANGAAVLGPDAKSQVTVRYENGKPVAATQIVLSTQHLDENLTSEDVRAIVEPYIRQTLPEGWISESTVWHVNPTGKFVIGGPDGDCGLTGARSSWTPTAARPRTGAAPFPARTPPRWTARRPTPRATSPRTWWAAKLAKRCVIQLSYAIGWRSPSPSTPTSTAPARWTSSARRSLDGDHGPVAPRHPHPSRPEQADLRPARRLMAISGATPEADGGFSWERTDLADTLRSAFA
jgi:S-adenosylmethionine synthetase